VDGQGGNVLDGWSGWTAADPRPKSLTAKYPSVKYPSVKYPSVRYSAVRYSAVKRPTVGRSAASP